METLDLSELRSQLLSLPASTKIHLIIFSEFCSFANYDYICSSVDALVILHLFTEDYLFQYQILSQ